MFLKQKIWCYRIFFGPHKFSSNGDFTVIFSLQETTFIEQLVEDESQMEGLPRCCSKIMNWHLHLDARHLVYPKRWQVSSNLEQDQ